MSKIACSRYASWRSPFCAYVSGLHLATFTADKGNALKVCTAISLAVWVLADIELDAIVVSHVHDFNVACVEVAVDVQASQIGGNGWVHCP